MTSLMFMKDRDCKRLQLLFNYNYYVTGCSISMELLLRRTLQRSEPHEASH